MNPIRKAINVRNNVYYESTQKLIALFVDKLNKAVQYFIKIDRDVDWKSVEFIPGSDIFVYIVGLVDIKIGDVVVYNESTKLVVDEDYLKTNPPRTPIRIMISVEDLDVMTAKELYEKIKEFYDLSSVMSHEQIANLITTNKITDISDVLDHVTSASFEKEDLTSSSKEEPSFDLAKLTEEQRQQLKFNFDKLKTKN